MEAFGLWRGRRWAEYLTLVAITVLLIAGLYELAYKVTALKVFALLINLAVVVYLLPSGGAAAGAPKSWKGTRQRPGSLHSHLRYLHNPHGRTSPARDCTESPTQHKESDVTTKVEKSIKVKVPVSTAYNQWTQFEDFPRFMGGITSVTQTGEDQLHWVAQIAGVKREWDARVLEQVPDHRVAWAATTGATNAGHVLFEPAKKDTTKVTLHLEYEPQGLVEKVGDKLGFVGNQAKADLKKFKKFIEAQGYATGAWRGTVNPGAGIGTPGVEHAAGSHRDSGKAGVSSTTIAGVLALTAGIGAGVAAAARAKSKSTATPATEPAAPAVVARAVVAPTQMTPVQSVPASTGIDAPASGLYEHTAEPHVLTDEDIAERTPDVPQAYAESDSASHEHSDPA